MKTSEYTRRVLMIGLDACDIELLKLWATEGSLPVIHSLMEKGRWGELDTISEVSHTAVWPSIITGTNPGKHGIYNIYQVEAGSNKVFRINAKHCVQPPFWKRLDSSGKKCIIIDVPFDYVTKTFSGIQITEWGSWVRYTDREGKPAHIWQELTHRFGIPPIENEASVQWFDADLLTRLRDWLITGIEKKKEAVKWLINSREWDFFFVFFPEVHPAGHFFWHLHDENYDLFSSHPSKKPENYLKEIYQGVDNAIGQIIPYLNEEDVLFIVSGDHMGSSYSGWHLLPQILARLDLMVSGNGNFHAGSGGGVSNRNDLSRRLRNMVPEKIRRRVSRALPMSIRYKMWQRWTTATLDWSSTKVFYVPNDCQGHLRINLKGREPTGIVEPGREYDELCLKIRNQLEEIINPVNGRRAVKQVIRTDQVFYGHLTQNLPDLLVVWDESAEITTELYSKQIGTVMNVSTAYELPPYFVGNHKGPGFVILLGGEITAGRLGDNHHIYDIAPTVLSLFQSSIPDAMDGKIWKRLFA